MDVRSPNPPNPQIPPLTLVGYPRRHLQGHSYLTQQLNVKYHPNITYDPNLTRYPLSTVRGDYAAPQST